MTLAADAVKDGLREKRMHDPRKSAPFLWGREHHTRCSLGPYDGCRSASKRLPGRFSRFARLTGVPETDHGTCDMCTNRPHLRCIRCDVEINYLRCVRTPELCVECPECANSKDNRTINHRAVGSQFNAGVGCMVYSRWRVCGRMVLRL